jgi:hypothetical protein
MAYLLSYTVYDVELKHQLNQLLMVHSLRPVSNFKSHLDGVGAGGVGVGGVGDGGTEAHLKW